MSTTSQTNASKPRCETVDLTLTWTDERGNLNVVKGDLIEENGQFEQIDCVHVDAWQPAVLVRYEGSHECHVKPLDGLVKVFRYIEHTEE